MVVLSSKMTVLDIARYLRVGWDLGKDHTALEAFFRRLRRSGAQLEAVAVDMSGAYLKAIRLYAPRGVVVVHDSYHVVSQMNDALDSIRKQDLKRLAEQGQKAVLGARYLLLTASEKLDEQPDRKARLDQLLAANELLHKAYLPKEDLRLFWSYGSKQEVADFLRMWCTEARALKNRHMTRMAGTISRAIFAILAWYDLPISTGPLEGINNKVKVMKRLAYG